MIGRIFSRMSREDEIFAEAQALIDDGLELEFVLDLYPEDADWLAPLLDTGIVIGESFAVEEPSYYFEASLKNRFIEAGMERAARERAPVAEPVAAVPAVPVQSGFFRWQGAMAGSAVAVVLGGLSVMTLGVVTAGDSVPGDWNYAFKLAGERIEYSLSSGDDRTDVQLNQALVRIEEMQKLYERGKVSEDTIAEVRKELEEVGNLVRERGQDLDPVQVEKAKHISASASVVLKEVKLSKPDLADEADDTIALAASVGGALTGIAAPTATPTTAATETPTETEVPTATPTATPTASPQPTETPTAEPSETAEPTAETTPEGNETAEPGPSEEPTQETPAGSITGTADTTELP